MENRSVCWGGQSTAVLLVSDGEPTSDNLGANVVTPLRTRNGGPVHCPPSAPCLGSSNDALYMLDDVAKLLHTNDLQASVPPVVGDFDTSGMQSVNVYTVGLGIDSNLLRNAANEGGGLSYRVNDVAGLKQAIQEVISLGMSP
ncbi:type IV pilin biogenesis protein [Stigmatella aurantiaca]|nr:type IV pilin biogenesis protein [Stigmatella aurantiaca]